MISRVVACESSAYHSELEQGLLVLVAGLVSVNYLNSLDLSSVEEPALWEV